MTEFATWFRSKLDGENMDRADFSHRSGVPLRTVSAWFTGSRVPSPASCDVIADVLLVDRDMVLAIAGHRPPDEPIDTGDPRRELMAIVRRVHWTPERVYSVKRTLESYIEFDRKGGKT